jgi:glycosyltransferase involved in cell wall biosynthesis
LKVLVVNKFLHHVGGIETYVDWQAKNFDKAGIEAHFLGMSPPPDHEILPSIVGRATFTPAREFNQGRGTAAKSAFSSIYSPTVERILESTIERVQPDIVHFHSTGRQLTPSVARAVRRKRLPGVVTAHEYKHVCASQRLWDDRKNEICTACLEGGVISRMTNVAIRRCVRGSTAASIFAIPEIPIADHFWGRSGVVIHAPSKFMGQVIEDAPYIPNQVRVLDLPWGPARQRSPKPGWAERVMYLGRLEKEKGVDLLLDAWKLVERSHGTAELVIAGSGSQEQALQEKTRATELRRVKFIGRYNRSDLSDMFGNVAVSVHPSRWLENSPFTVRESLMHGVPAIVSDAGGMSELVDSECGRAVPVGDAVALSDAILGELSRRQADSPQLRSAVQARAMSDEDHLKGLRELYDCAKAVAAGGPSQPSRLNVG